MKKGRGEIDRKSGSSASQLQFSTFPFVNENERIPRSNINVIHHKSADEYEPDFIHLLEVPGP